MVPNAVHATLELLVAKGRPHAEQSSFDVKVHEVLRNHEAGQRSVTQCAWLSLHQFLFALHASTVYSFVEPRSKSKASMFHDLHAALNSAGH